jgi:iron(II)-dependent oxidoreductase
MLASAPRQATGLPSVEALGAAMEQARRRTLALIDGISAADLERVHSPLMSPLVWDLGHIAAFEDLWLVHRLGRRPLLRADLAEVYDAFETPRAERGTLPILDTEDALAYMREVREQALATLRDIGPSYEHELVLRHEQQHNETMLQTLELARLADHRPARRKAPGRAVGAIDAGELDLVPIPAGPADIGALAEGFAYDNERPRHRVHVAAYRIGRTPVTNASWLRFSEGGGYQRREWWSREGWAWKEDQDITRPAGWTGDGREWRIGGYEPIDPGKPVVHVSWFEADAFARAHGARLPTEIEWEKAATWDQQTGTARSFPWGNEELRPGVHANVDHIGRGPADAEGHPDGASPYGCVGMIGDVWEWTSSPFRGYRGFSAYPYREYSEVFFGGDYKVLRGGSWATRARVATPTFRNWDFPQRRQIFAGFRIARDLA